MTETTPTIAVFPDPEVLAEAAARRFMATAQQAMDRYGRFSVALAGGSSPRGLYRRLAAAPFAEALDWRKVDIFWGDERNVPQDHAASNFRMAAEALLRRVPLPPQNIHPMTAGGDPRQAADRYDALLQAYFSRPPGRFDLILLGMGADGHTASLFPGSAAVTAAAPKGPTRRVMAQHIDKLNDWRITLTPETINRAALIIFLVTGADKAATVKEVLNGPHRPAALPSQLVRPAAGRLIWMLDAAAARELDPQAHRDVLPGRMDPERK
ncbi:MAG: 6-phosphogluconolactonase [Desulfobacterales bacterium]|jgi:6-phosphogluconolactonase